MKKIVLFLTAIVLLWPKAVFAQDVITLDTSYKPSFTDTVLDEDDEDDDPVIDLDDNSVYVDGPRKRYKERHAGPFVRAPKQNIEEPSTQQRSAIQDYDPSMGAPNPKFFLFDVITKTAKDVYNLQIERTDVPAALLKWTKVLLKMFTYGQQFKAIFQQLFQKEETPTPNLMLD